MSGSKEKVMRTVVGYLIVAAGLAIAGWVLWSGSALERRVAAAERDLVTLRYQEAGARAACAAKSSSLQSASSGRTVSCAAFTRASRPSVMSPPESRSSVR